MFEPGGKAPDGHIGESVESVEIDVEMLLQLPFVVGFKFCLVRREKVTIGIVNEVERKVSHTTVSETVQKLKGADTGIEDAVAPLGIDIVDLVTRHRGDDFHAVDLEKASQPLIAWFNQNRQVTPVNDGFHLRHFPELPDQDTGNQASSRVRLRSGPRCVISVFDSHPRIRSIGLPGDYLPALRAGIHVAMDAGEVAKFAQIQLKDICAGCDGKTSGDRPES